MVSLSVNVCMLISSSSCIDSLTICRISAFKRWTNSLAVKAYNKYYKFHIYNTINNKLFIFIIYIFIITCKWGVICLINGFEISSVSSSVSSLHPDVIKRAIESSFASNNDVTRSFFDEAFWRLLSLESAA